MPPNDPAPPDAPKASPAAPAAPAPAPAVAAPAAKAPDNPPAGKQAEPRFRVLWDGVGPHNKGALVTAADLGGDPERLLRQGAIGRE